MYGEKNSYAHYPSECPFKIENENLLYELKNYNNRNYYFKFVTKNDCVFYGNFDKIYATLIN